MRLMHALFVFAALRTHTKKYTHTLFTLDYCAEECRWREKNLSQSNKKSTRSFEHYLIMTINVKTIKPHARSLTCVWFDGFCGERFFVVFFLYYCINQPFKSFVQAAHVFSSAENVSKPHVSLRPGPGTHDDLCVRS